MGSQTYPSQRNPIATSDLVLKIQRGEKECFSEIVRRSFEDTYALAYKITQDHHDASDVVQETYIRAYRSIDKFEFNSAFSTWLFRITANCAYSFIKDKQKRQPADFTELEDLQSGHGDPVAVIFAKADKSKIENALKSLAPQLRAVLVLKDMYGFSVKEIAKHLGISIPATKTRIHRARKILRAYIETDEASGRKMEAKDALQVG
jgi:RNA polymerase sigma-70 factor (ECF subfamily)